MTTYTRVLSESLATNAKIKSYINGLEVLPNVQFWINDLGFVRFNSTIDELGFIGFTKVDDLGLRIFEPSRLISFVDNTYLVASQIKKDIKKIILHFVNIDDTHRLEFKAIISDLFAVQDKLIKKVSRSLSDAFLSFTSLLKESKIIRLVNLAITSRTPIKALQTIRSTAFNIIASASKKVSRARTDIFSTSSNILRSMQKEVRNVVFITEENLYLTNLYVEEILNILEITFLKEIEKTIRHLVSITASIFNKQLITTRTEAILIAEPIFSKLFSKSILHAITLISRLTKQTYKELSETLILIGLATKKIYSYLEEMLAVIYNIEVRAKGLLYVEEERFGISTQILRKITKDIAESLTIVEDCIRSAERKMTISDILIVLDDVTNFCSMVTFEIIVVSDNFNKQILRSISDLIISVDTIVKSVTKHVADNTVIVEAYFKNINKFFSAAVVSLTAFTASIDRAVSDTMLLIAVTNSSTSKYVLDITNIIPTAIKEIILYGYQDVLGITESTVTKLLNRFVNDMLTFTEALNKDGRLIIEEVIAVLDAYAGRTAISFEDSFTFIDTWLRTHSKAFYEDFTFVENILKQTHKVILNDIFLRTAFALRGYIRNVNDAFTVIDAYNNRIEKFVQDIVLAVEEISKIINKYINDIFIQIDIVFKVKRISFFDSFTALEGLAKDVRLFYEDLFIFIDDVHKYTAMSIIDVLLVVEITVIKGISRYIAEAMLLIDSVWKRIWHTFSIVVGYVLTWYERSKRKGYKTLKYVTHVLSLKFKRSK